MVPVTRPMRLQHGTAYSAITVQARGRRPTSGHRVDFFLPQGPLGPNSTPWCGMDPSDPNTWVRPWRPQPGMIGYLNFDGAQIQGDTDMGGLWSRPAKRKRLASIRPRKRRNRGTA
jgi:hypothetical protein